MLFLDLWMLLLLPQAAQAPVPEERVRVDYVLVEVTARDSRDRLVTDLKLEDFTLRDGGRKIALESLDILDLRGDGSAAAEADTSVVDIRLPRLRGSRVLLAVDFQFADHRGVNETFRQLEEYLEGTSEHSDLSYLLYSLENGALMEDFNTSPSIVLEELRAYRRRYDERRQGLRRDDEISDLAELEQYIGMCGNGPGYASCVLQALQAFLEAENARTETVFRELESLVERFPDNELVHSIVFISPGFSLHPGSAGVQLAAAFLGQGDGTSLANRVGGGLPGTLSYEDRMDSMVESFAQRRVIFHGFDIYNGDSGLNRKADVSSRNVPTDGVVSSYDSYQKELERGMRDLARATGGVFQVYLNKMRPVLEGDRFVYVLGYTRPAGDTDGFHKLKIKCKRGGVRLRHRRGYQG